MPAQYDSVMESDPYKHIEGSGPSDEIWGEWGLDRDLPDMPERDALKHLLMVRARVRRADEARLAAASVRRAT